MYTKKKFLDVPECLLLELENLKSEVQVLRCTVDSKSRAVVILRKQLAAVKEHAGILDTRHQGTQTDSKPTLHESGSGSPERESPHSSSNVLAELLSSCKRENKALRQDILNLKCKLHDAQTDLKAVRQEIPMLVAGSGSGLAAPGPLQQQWQRQERLHLIAQLETLTDKVASLTNDVRCLATDKDELLREREHNHSTIASLSAALHAATDDGHVSPQIHAQRHQAYQEETKLKTTDRGMAAKLAPHISDYELLASLQRAAQGNRNFPHTSGADGVTLALENNSLSAVSETRLERTAAHIHRVVAAAPQSQCDSPSNSSGDGNMSPVADNEDVNASVKAENDVENYEKSLTSLNRTDSIDAPRPLLFSSKNSTTAMQPPDGQVRESKKFASMLEAENEHLRDTEYLVVDCPEEIVSIVELGLCSSINRSPHVESSREDQINSIECLVENPDSSFSSNNSSTKFNDGILTVETNSFSMTNKDPLPQHEESIPCGEKLTGHQAAIDSHETSDGFSDYDSDDGGLEAELSQWHKSAGALLSKAQKRAD